MMADEEVWVVVLSQYLHQVDQRRIRAHFGVGVPSLILIWHFVNIPFAAAGLRPKHLLWTLYFLRVYPTEDQGANWVGVSRLTYRLRIRQCINILNTHLRTVLFCTCSSKLTSLPLQIDFSRRFVANQRLQGSCSIDTTCCPIAMPFQAQQEYYCSKCKRHVLKYEVAVNLQSGQVVWVNGGFPGRMHDLTISTQGFLQQLLQGETAFADKGYAGCDTFLIPYHGQQVRLSPARAQWNALHTRVHFEHMERVNKRFKLWKVLKIPWRGELVLHSHVFHALARIVNVDLLYHPLNAE